MGGILWRWEQSVTGQWAAAVMNQESGLSLMSITLDNSLHVHCQLCDRVKNLMIQINDTFDIESTKVGRSCKRLSLCRSSFYILLSSCLLVICYRRAKACFSWIWIHRYIYHLQLWRFYLETLKTDSSVSRPEFCLYLFTYHGDLSKTVWVQSKSLTAAPY